MDASVAGLPCVEELCLSGGLRPEWSRLKFELHSGTGWRNGYTRGSSVLRGHLRGLGCRHYIPTGTCHNLLRTNNVV